eukprot:10976-Heterococcus_DN1.PRE.2
MSLAATTASVTAAATAATAAAASVACLRVGCTTTRDTKWLAPSVNIKSTLLTILKVIMWNRYARDVCDSIKMFDSSIAEIAACMVWGSGDKPRSAIHKPQIIVISITTLKGMLSESCTRGLTRAPAHQGEMSADALPSSQKAPQLCIGFYMAH